MLDDQEIADIARFRCGKTFSSNRGLESTFNAGNVARVENQIESDQSALALPVENRKMTGGSQSNFKSKLNQPKKENRAKRMERLFQFGWKRLVRYFMQGLLAILPLALTVAIVSWFFNFLKGIFGPKTYIGERLAQIGVSLFRETGLKGDEAIAETVLGYLIGIGSVLVVLFCLGVFLELGAKRFMHGLSDRLFRQIPIIGSLYGSMKQLVDLFDQPEEAEIKSMSVVFCHFAEGGGTGVLALMPSSEKILIDEVEYNVVMIPTAPFPFGGGLIFIPAKQVKAVDMSVDNFMSIYVSMGVSTPEFMRQRSDRIAPQIVGGDHQPYNNET